MLTTAKLENTRSRARVRKATVAIGAKNLRVVPSLVAIGERLRRDAHMQMPRLIVGCCEQYLRARSPLSRDFDRRLQRRNFRTRHCEPRVAAAQIAAHASGRRRRCCVAKAASRAPRHAPIVQLAHRLSRAYQQHQRL